MELLQYLIAESIRHWVLVCCIEWILPIESLYMKIFSSLRSLVLRLAVPMCAQATKLGVHPLAPYHVFSE